MFYLALCFSIGFSACGFWSKRAENSNAANPTPFTAQEIPSEIPFSNREPEVFQCEIIVSSFINGEKQERKTFVARSGGGRRLTIFAAGEKAEIAFLQTGETGAFSISQEKKVYTENAAGRASPESSGENFNDFLTVAWLNAKASAVFENLGAENGLSKFLVRLNDSDASEILIYVDENLKIPVRQEFFSRAGDDKILLCTVELKNFQLQTDDKLFELPSKDFRKVSREEFDKIVRQ